MDAFAGRDFEDEVRDKNPSEKYVNGFQRAIYRLVEIPHFNKGNAERSRAEPGDCAGFTFGTNSAGNKGNRPVGGKTARRDGSIQWQESAIEAWTRPIALTAHMGSFAVCQHRYALCSRES